MVCPVCQTNSATIDRDLGVLPCDSCQARQANLQRPNKPVEITTADIKSSRIEYQDEILQPFREGQLSKEYLDKYGTKTIKATKQEIKNAKNVWNLGYYKD